MKTAVEMAREAGAIVLDGSDTTVIERLVELARADEREGCAALCDQLSDSSRDLRFGAAIRARGQA